MGSAVHDTPTTLAVMEAIDSPGFGVNMDPSHIHRAGEDVVEALRAVVGHVRHVHIRDLFRRGNPRPDLPPSRRAAAARSTWPATAACSRRPATTAR